MAACLAVSQDLLLLLLLPKLVSLQTLARLDLAKPGCPWALSLPDWDRHLCPLQPRDLPSPCQPQPWPLHLPLAPGVPLDLPLVRPQLQDPPLLPLLQPLLLPLLLALQRRQHQGPPFVPPRPCFPGRRALRSEGCHCLAEAARRWQPGVPQRKRQAQR